MVANGEPARVLALLDPDSDLADVLGRTGRAVVQLLAGSTATWPRRSPGTAPAPGGPFRTGEFEPTAWGPRLSTRATWAGRRASSRRTGRLVDAGDLRARGGRGR